MAGTDEELLEFTRRLEKHKMVANFQHPFFLTLMGCITVDQPFYLVTEMPENGDLLTFLQKHKTKVKPTVCYVSDVSVFITSLNIAAN